MEIATIKEVLQWLKRVGWVRRQFRRNPTTKGSLSPTKWQPRYKGE